MVPKNDSDFLGTIPLGLVYHRRSNRPYLFAQAQIRSSISLSQGALEEVHGGIRDGRLLQNIKVQRQREFFIDNLLVRIHLIIEMILVNRPCAMTV